MTVLLTGCQKKEEKKENNQEIKPIYNVKYKEVGEYACITFRDEKKYSMYDCDSEPTHYFFDSESECEYEFKGNKIYFDCKYEYEEHKRDYIEIITWTKDELIFNYEGEIKTFKKEAE